MDFHSFAIYELLKNNNKNRQFSPRKAGGCFVILIVIAIIGLCNWIAMLIWNWIIPAIFDGHGVINFWQMLILTILINILFGRGNSK